MSNSETLHYKTITEVADDIKTRRVSPVELTKTLLRRIDELDPCYKSYAIVMSDHAIESAKQAEREITNGEYRGPLHGVPIAVKDLCFTAGVRTMGGTKVLADHVPTFDATVVSRLAEAGSVLLGKLNLAEAAMGGYSPGFDVPLNPWNVTRWSGASSSGSAVATALGLCFASLGTDTGGSIRYPAGACGTVGLKPTWGRVSRYGVLDLAQSLDHVGPLTRSSVDAAIMLNVIGGLDLNDPTTLPTPISPMMEDFEKGVDGLRIGMDESYCTDGVDPEVSQAVLKAVKIMESLGAQIIETKMPDVDQYYLSSWRTIFAAEAVQAHQDYYPERYDEYGPLVQGWLDFGSQITGSEYAEANNRRNELNGRLKLAFQNIDVLACPTMFQPAHPITMEEMYAPDVDRDPAHQRFTVPFDLNGAPTISLPCGFHSDGMPISLQFVGHPLTEYLLCRVGYVYESATNWHTMHPKL